MSELATPTPQSILAMTRATAKATTRIEIMSSARLLFSAFEYEAVGIRKIARWAGRSTGAVFAHWPDKASLFAECVGRRPYTDRDGAALAAALTARGVDVGEVLSENRP